MTYPGQVFKAKECKWCGNEYQPMSANASYCSKRCKMDNENEVSRMRYKEDPEYKEKCNILTKKHGDIYRKQGAAYIRELKEDSQCVYCEEAHPACLSFHHRYPSEKEYNIPRMVADRLSIAKIKEEIAKCDIVCENCHRKIHYEEKHNGVTLYGDRPA